MSTTPTLVVTNRSDGGLNLTYTINTVVPGNSNLYDVWLKYYRSDQPGVPRLEKLNTQTLTSPGQRNYVFIGILGITWTFSVYQKGAITNTVSSDSTPPISAITCIPPYAPTINSITAGNTIITITYTPGTGPNNNGPNDYYEYSTNGTDYISTESASTSYTITGLTNGTSYTVYLRAHNPSGSGASTSAGPVTPVPPYTSPSAPTSVTLAVTSSSTTITATITQASNNGNALNGYYYAINGTSYGSKITPYPATNQFTFTGSYGTSYYVNVIVVNDAGNSGVTTSNTITPFTTPAAPTINSIVASTTGSVILNYATNSNNGSVITGNTFTYSNSVTFTSSYTGITFNSPLTVNPTSSPYTLSGLTNGTPYYFKLTSSNTAGSSSETIYTKYVTPSLSPLLGYSGTYSTTMSITTGDYTGYNTNFNTDDTNKYGHYLYFTTAVTTTFTNSGNIYSAGGGTNIISGVPIAYNGGHAIYIAPSITIQTLKNYGNLLGGGGGGVSTNTGRVGGYGGAGGGGGGLAIAARGSNGIVNGGAGGANSANTVSGGAGGSYSVSTYIPGVTSTDGGGGYGGGNSTNGGGGGGGGNSTNGGEGGYSVYNGGNITNLYNLQGGSSSKGPLFYAGNMPTNYYIRVNSATNYGQLYYTGWGATSSISISNIQIDPASSNTFTAGTTFPAVLVGNFSNIDTTSKAATGYYWNLSRNGTATISGVSTYVVYDLVITAEDTRPSSGTGVITASSLSLSGYIGSTINQNYISSINNANVISTNTGNLISATAAYRIASGVGFTINSDKRIKKNMEPLCSSDSLQIVKALKPSSFQFVDFMKGGVSKYGYLAQEVEAVIPNVVNRNPAYIPNFFEIVKMDSENPNKIVLKEKTTESLAIGTKVQFYDIYDNIIYREVQEIVDEKTFMISEPLLEIDPLFLYGQLVDDYRSIDNDQINTVLLSALQECSKKIEKQEQKLDHLEKLLEEL